MPSTRYGVSPWLDGLPSKKRPSHPVFRGEVEAPVVVIGAGMTGMMTAYACAVAGLAPIVLEADRVGSGGSGQASGVCAGEGAASFFDMEQAAGRRVTRAHFDHVRRSVLDLAAAVKRLGIKAELGLVDTLRIVPPGGAVKMWRKDFDARIAADADVTWRKPAAVTKTAAVDSDGGMRLTGWATCDPFRLVLGFAQAAAERGARIYERSAVRRITFNRKVATVVTAGGRITSAHVLHCTGEPTALVGALRRHFRYDARSLVLTDVLPTPVRKAVGSRTEILCDTDVPPHLVRWMPDHRVLVSGADGARPTAQQAMKVHVQRTGQLMYELSRLYPAISGVAPAYGWTVPLAHGHDGGLHAGPHRNFPHQLFAFGVEHDPARAFLASRILVRHVLGQTTSDDEHFGFARTL